MPGIWSYWSLHRISPTLRTISVPMPRSARYMAIWVPVWIKPKTPSPSVPYQRPTSTKNTYIKTYPTKLNPKAIHDRRSMSIRCWSPRTIRSFSRIKEIMQTLHRKKQKRNIISAWKLSCLPEQPDTSGHMLRSTFFRVDTKLLFLIISVTPIKE